MRGRLEYRGCSSTFDEARIEPIEIGRGTVAGGLKIFIRSNGLLEFVIFLVVVLCITLSFGKQVFACRYIRKRAFFGTLR